MKRAALRLGLVLLLAAPALAEPVKGGAKPAEGAAEGEQRVVRVARELFGTEVTALVAVRGDEQARLAAGHVEDAFRELKRIEALTDEARESSDVARVNAAAGGEPVVVSPEVFSLASEALRVARLSKGAFDPTFAAVSDLWSFPAHGEGEGKAAEEAALKERLALVGYRDVKADEAARTLQLARKGQRMDLGGLTKGYALDRAAALLDERGYQNFVLAAGGDLVVRGKRGGRPWKVGIQDPRATGHFAALEATPGAVMTTGDYERFFEHGGKRLHHVLDPRTGAPAEGVRSATVVAADGMTADALSTALFVLGEKRGLRLINKLRHTEAVLVTADNRVVVSRGLEKRLRWRPPTDGS